MLALVAGDGALPGLVAARLTQPFVLCVPMGSQPKVTGAVMRLNFRLETLGTLLATLRGYGVSQVCFAGAVRRPTLDGAAVDDATRPLIEQVMAALRIGDDGALRVVLSLFEQAGIAVVAAHDVLPDLLLPTGVPTKAKPNDADGVDAARGEAIVAAMGQVDVGQACVVAGGQALAIEALPGTDWMLDSLCDPVNPPSKSYEPLSFAIDIVADWLSGGPAPKSHRRDGLPEGGLLYKAPKPSQDRRVDMPTIGPATMRRAAEAGLRGVVIEAGGVLVLEPVTLIGIADACGMFLWVRDRGLRPQ